MPGGYLLIHDIFENPEAGGQAPWEVYERARDCGRFETLARVKTLGVLRRK
jgi:MMP 1-O-methyltransferase